MRQNICEVIRRELDELRLDETCSSGAIEHLRECGACREFHEKQTKLRQIVGSLGTVAAPADFDFRLRARLANESSNTSHFSFMPIFVSGPVLRRAFAAAALLVVFATGAYLVRNVLNQQTATDQMAKKAPAPAVQETPKPLQVVTPNTQEAPKENMVVVSNKPPQGNRTERHRQVAIRNTPRLATVDSASTRAEVINGAEPLASSAAFPIDTSSVQYFKFSVDDGRGNAKTISVPTISFGSQRLMQNANQFAPKKIW